MRLKLTLSVDPNYNLLPFNYQYPVYSWLIKQIHFGDHDFARWLHDEGFVTGGKQFKLFTFSKIGLRKFRKTPRGFVIQSRFVDLHISFYTFKAIESFLSGIFYEQKMIIESAGLISAFAIDKIETLPEPEFNSTMKLRTSSPIVISRPVRYKGKYSKEYLAPDHPEYADYLIRNLIEKYSVIHNKTFNNYTYSDNDFSIIGVFKSRLNTIKQGKAEETKVRGYLYQYAIKIPLEFMRIGYFSGFGEKNSMGYGYVDILNNEEKDVQVNGR